MALRQVAQVAKGADIDLILTGGKVITMDSGNRLAEAVAIENGKIRAVGSNAEILEKTGTDTKIEHLSGRTLLPEIAGPLAPRRFARRLKKNELKPWLN